jgi:hypothetical protein
MLLPEMDNMLAWGYKQQLLQDTPDIPGNLEPHTSVQQHSVRTSANTSFSHCVLVTDAMNQYHSKWGSKLVCVSNLSPTLTILTGMFWEFLLSNQANAGIVGRTCPW